jgi:uncharacterized protein (TIGR03086 family)
MSFTKTALLPVTPDEAFALITEPERLRRWQTVSAVVDLRAGGGYRWTITPGHVAAGTFREVEPGRRIVFGWGWEGNDDLKPDASTVTLTVEPADGGSRVTIVHEGLTDEQGAMHAEGWNHYFERLERLATTGDAGQDEWAFAPENLTPITAADAALAVLQPVLRNLTAEDRPKPTPCSEFTCHDLAEHLFDSLTRLGAMAGATVVNPEEGSLENRVSVMAAQVIDAWRTVDLSGSVPGPGRSEMPASFGAAILPLELVLHGWDMAQGSGQRLHISDELVDYVRRLADGVLPTGRSLGSFADEVAPADGADAIDRLAAYAGRRPIAA